MSIIFILAHYYVSSPTWQCTHVHALLAHVPGVDFNERGEIITNKGLKICTGQIQELVLGGLNQAVAGKLVSSVNILRDSYTGRTGWDRFSPLYVWDIDEVCVWWGWGDV